MGSFEAILEKAEESSWSLRSAGEGREELLSWNARTEWRDEYPFGSRQAG